MAKHPRLHRRGTVYYFRAKIPADLLLHFHPAKERTFSLKTTELREALQRVRVESVKFDQEMAQARSQREATPKTTLSQLEIDRLCAIFRYRLLEEDESCRMDGAGDEDLYLSVKQQVEKKAGGKAFFTDDQARRTFGMSDREFSKSAESIETVRETLKQALARGNTTPVRSEVDELLQEQAIRLDVSSKDYAQLSLQFLKTFVKTMDELAGRQNGEVVDTPEKPPPLSIQASSPCEDNPPLSHVFEMYKAEKQQLSPKTILDFTPNIRRFVDLHGDLGIKDITRDHVRKFKEAMLQVPARLPSDLSGLPLPKVLERTRDDLALRRLSPKTVNEKAEKQCFSKASPCSLKADCTWAS